MHGIDEDEVAAIAFDADAVDEERDRLAQRYLYDVVAVGVPGEEGEHVELGLVGRSRGAAAGEKREREGQRQLHCRPASSESTIVGSARVDVSPKPSVAPSAIFLRMRRMILPERVLGSAAVKWILSGAASAPICLRTAWLSSFRKPSSPSSRAFKVTNA